MSVRLSFVKFVCGIERRDEDSFKLITALIVSAVCGYLLRQKWGPSFCAISNFFFSFFFWHIYIYVE